MKTPTERTYNLHIVIRPAADLPGKWIAHCLDVDVVTYGDSLTHAISMAKEAVEMVFVDDLGAGHEPLERRAPKEFWDEMWKRLMPKTVALPLREVLKRSGVAYVILEPTLRCFLVRENKPARGPEIEVPVAHAPLARCHC